MRIKLFNKNINLVVSVLLSLILIAVSIIYSKDIYAQSQTNPQKIVAENTNTSEVTKNKETHNPKSKDNKNQSKVDSKNDNQNSNTTVTVILSIVVAVVVLVVGFMLMPEASMDFSLFRTDKYYEKLEKKQKDKNKNKNKK